MKKISTLYLKDPNNLGLVINQLDLNNQWVMDGEVIPTRKMDGTASAIIDGNLYKRFDAKLKSLGSLKKLGYYIKYLTEGSKVVKVSKKKFTDNSLFDVIESFTVHPKTGEPSAKLVSNGIIDVRQLRPIDIEIPKEYYKNIPEGAIPCQEPDLISGHHPHWIKCDSNNPQDKWHFEAFGRGEFEDGTYELCGERIQGNPEKIRGHKLIKHGSEVLDIDDYSFESIKTFLNENDIEGIVFHHKNDGKMCKIRKTDFNIKR